MDLYQAEILAKTLIKEFAPPGWGFEWMNEKTVNGRCYYLESMIKLSRHLTKIREVVPVRTTVMHEICHSRVGPGKGHGPVWQAEMRKFGLPANRCSVDQPDRASISNWTAQCPSCGKVNYMIRKPRVERSCGLCSYGKFNRAYLLTWRKI